MLFLFFDRTLRIHYTVYIKLNLFKTLKYVEINKYLTRTSFQEEISALTRSVSSPLGFFFHIHSI